MAGILTHGASDPRRYKLATTGPPLAPQAPGPATPLSPRPPLGTGPESPDWNWLNPQQNPQKYRDLKTHLLIEIYPENSEV